MVDRDLEAHIELLSRYYLMDTSNILLCIDVDSMFYRDRVQERDKLREKMLHLLSILEEHYMSIPFDELICNLDLSGLYVIQKLLPKYDALAKEFNQRAEKWIKAIDDLQSTLTLMAERNEFTEYEWFEALRHLEDAGSSVESLSSDITPIFSALNALSEYKAKVQQFLREPNQELYQDTVRMLKSSDEIPYQKLGEGLDPQIGRTMIAISMWLIRVNEEPIRKSYEKLDTLKNVIMAVPPAEFYGSVDELRNPTRDISFEDQAYEFSPLLVVHNILPTYRQKIEQFLNTPNNKLYKEIQSLRKVIGYVHQVYQSNFFTSLGALPKDYDSPVVRATMVSRI